MKAKKIGVLLFVIYWFIVYGLSFYDNESLNAQLREIIPTSYKMFAPATKTHYDVEYRFYKNGKQMKQLVFSDYLAAEYKKSILKDKTSFIKEKLYQGNLKVLDFNYQQAVYAEKYKEKPNDFEERIVSNPLLTKTLQNLRNFPKLYLKENPNLEADSVVIFVHRKPMILSYTPEYKDDFTYHLGEMCFFKTYTLLNR
jgi:hypothetical protein